MRRALAYLAAFIGLVCVAIAGTIAFDAPTAPPPQRDVAAPFRSVDFSDLPAVARYPARDGAMLAYRTYQPAPTGGPERLVVLIHGSGGSGTSMHATAKALAAAGATVIVPDIRGHGQSGPPGDISYIGQLEDDLEDLLTDAARTHKQAETTLIGFSSGGGFALRIAGGRLGTRFSRFMLLAPYLRYDAPNAREDGGAAGWTSVAVPRLLALSLINQLGITAFNGLPVLAFGVEAGDPHHLTAAYSYQLLTNFGPDDDWRGDLRRTQRPVMAIGGAGDELFRTDRLKAALDEGRPGIRVDVVPEVGHIGLTTAAAGTAAIVRAWSGPF